MTESITNAVRATATSKISMNASLNYALLVIALFGAGALTLAILIW